MTSQNFSWKFNLEKIRKARKDEGSYLLRTNMIDEDPAALWKQYMLQGEIEQSFKEVKNDLGLRPVFHQTDDRIEAHIFVSYVAYCLQATLKNLTSDIASGLSPKEIIAKMKQLYMVDVKKPTSDGREIVMKRYVEPKPETALLLREMDLQLPTQPPPKIGSDAINEVVM